MSPMPPLPTTVPLVLLVEYGKHSDSSYDEQYSKKEEILWVFTLDRYDLSFIVNGKKDDPIELRIFDFTFTKELIWKAWCNIGFIPMNSKCLENFKVRQ